MIKYIFLVGMALSFYCASGQVTFEEKEQQEESLMFKYFRESKTKGDSCWVLFRQHQKLVCRMLELLIRNKMIVDTISTPGTTIYIQRSLRERNFPKL